MNTKIMTFDYANYLNTNPTSSPVYSFMGTGFSSLGETPAPNVESTIYINDKSATKTIINYDGTYSFDADFIKGESAVDFIYDVCRNHKTGTDAESDYIKVELFNPVAGEANTFKARKFRVAIEVSEHTGEAGGVQKMTGNLNGVGDFVDGKFNVSARTFTETTATLGSLNVISLAGTLAGDTAITVSPAVGAGNSYVYSTGASVSMPYLDQSLSAWTDWDGSDEITATTGHELVIAEVDSTDKCKKAGKVIVVSAAE